MRLFKIGIVFFCSWVVGSVWAQSDLETSIRSIVYTPNDLHGFPEAAYGSLLGIHAQAADGLYIHEPMDLVVVARKNYSDRSIILDFYRLSMLLRTPPSARKPVQSFPVTIGEVLTKEGMSTIVDISFHPTQPLIYMRLRGINVGNEKEKQDLFREHYKQPFIIFRWRNNQATMVFRSNFPAGVDSNSGGEMFVPHRGDRMYFGNVLIPPTRANRNRGNRQATMAWIPLGPDGLPTAAADQLEFESMTDISMLTPWQFNFGRQMLEIEKDIYLVSSAIGPLIFNPAFRRSPVSSAHGGRRNDCWIAYNRKYPSIYFAEPGTQRFGRAGYLNGAYTDVLQEGWTGGYNITGAPAVMSRYNILVVPHGLGILAISLDEFGRLTPRAYIYRVSGGVSNVVYHEASGKLIYTTHNQSAVR